MGSAGATARPTRSGAAYGVTTKNFMDEKLKNLIYYKMYVTDQERDEMFSSPLYWVYLGVVVVGLLFVSQFLNHGKM